MNIEKLLSYAISDDDIIATTKINNIITYNQIKRFNDIDELLTNLKSCFLLFESSNNFGHWCLLFKNDNDLIEFFDPYGVFIENQKSYINDEKFKEPINYLSILLKKSPYQISYNEFEFQDINNDIVGTCGKWCIIRYLNRDKDLYKFKDMIDMDMKKMNIDNSDVLIVKIFYYLFNI